MTDRNTRRTRGFSLIEALIALALVGVVSSLVVGVVSSMHGTLYETGERVEADQEMLLLAEWMSAELQAVGGGPLEPAMSLFVENDVRGDGADRLLTVSLDEDSSICGIVDTTESNIFALSYDRGSGACCMDETIEGRQVMAVSADRAFWRSLRVGAVDDTAFVCQVKFAIDGARPPESAITASGLATDLDAAPERGDGGDDAFLFGSLIAVDVQRYTVKPAARLLIRERDADPLDGEFENEILADRVIEFQAALGYDNDNDGDLEEDGSVNDEWLYNHASDVLGRGGLVDAEIDDLRGLQVGLGIAWPVSGDERTETLTLMDGPERSSDDERLLGQRVRASFRADVGFE